MFCMHCGREVDPTQKFCSSCGTPVLQPSSATPHTAAVTEQELLDRPSALGRRHIITDIVMPLIILLLILFTLRFFEFGTIQCTIEVEKASYTDSKTNTEPIVSINEWWEEYNNPTLGGKPWLASEPVLFGILTFLSIAFCLLPLFLNCTPKWWMLLPTIMTALWCVALIIGFLYQGIVFLQEQLDSLLKPFSFFASINSCISCYVLPTTVGVLFIMLTVALLVYPFFLFAPINRGEYS